MSFAVGAPLFGTLVAFVVAYAADWADETQILGLSLGAALTLIAVACVVASRHLVVTEQIEEHYPERTVFLLEERSTARTGPDLREEAILW